MNHPSCWVKKKPHPAWHCYEQLKQILQSCVARSDYKQSAKLPFSRAPCFHKEACAHSFRSCRCLMFDVEHQMLRYLPIVDVNQEQCLDQMRFLPWGVVTCQLRAPWSANVTQQPNVHSGIATGESDHVLPRVLKVTTCN
uniref:Uncharacterized protein n=1 Tax=Rhipicephalus zambeziensis TaxID=60191 RepID=A0A224YF03_9ACAR